MSERETRTFTTTGGHVVVVKSYLTGKEANEIKNVLLGNIKMSMEDIASGSAQIKDIPASFVTEQESKTVEMMLVSIDEVTENVFAVYEELPENECDEISAQIKEIRTPLAEKK